MPRRACSGARPGVSHAIETMFDQIGKGTGKAGLLAASGSQIVSLKETAVVLLDRTPGIQLPMHLLLFARTLAQLFALGERAIPLGSPPMTR